MTNSYAEIAHEKIILLIKEGILKPGQRVMETDIAKRTNLSRTPVREALKKLEAEEIIIHQAKIGAVIKKFNHQDVIELYEVRIMLEKMAAKLAAQHATMSEIDLLKKYNNKIVDAEEQEKAASYNSQFHQIIIQSTRNRYLQKAWEQLTKSIILLGPTTLYSETRYQEAYYQHHDIIKAIENKDAEHAMVMAEDHMNRSLEIRLTHIHDGSY